MTDQPKDSPAQDTTRDWAGEEAEALRIEQEREKKLREQQRQRE